MKPNKHGIFTKVFVYTMLMIMLVVGVTAALFAQQIVSFYHTAQLRQLNASFQALTDDMQAANPREYTRIAREFSDRNQSYSFVLQSPLGRVMFASINLDEMALQDQRHNIVLSVGAGYTISASVPSVVDEDLRYLAKTIAGGMLLIIVLCTAAAVLFARGMTRPIALLVSDAVAMSRLEPVSAPAKRGDELGLLSEIVHDMYGNLKHTIADLEEEKEAQRYFFAAASHELKTPIAATNALLQGMLDNVGDYQNHPKYLVECLKMTNEQNKIINEILEIVKLTDGKIVPNFEVVNISGLVDDVVARYQHLTERKELALEIDICDQLECTADPAMLDRALSNVIINAVQNTQNGGSIRIWSGQLPQRDGYVRLNVLNRDAFIDEEVLPKLFNPFFRMDEARTQSGRSGLGLTLVAKTLGCMGFEFALENSSEGVLFWVDLPRA